jgi:L-malate glycosyltransferase
MKTILFIGNFLSRSKGTINPSEKLVSRLEASGYVTLHASSYRNLVGRFLHIMTLTIIKRYDIIHIDVFSGRALWFALVSCMVARFRNKRIILSLHGGKLPVVFKRKQKRIEFLFKQTFLVSPSLYLKEFFEAKGFSVQYIPNSIDLGSFPYTWQPSCLQIRKIIWVRAFSEIYRPILAIKTVLEILKKYPDTTLTMIGPPGDWSNQTEEFIQAQGLSHQVFVLKPVNNSELKNYLTTHSVFLNTTRYESFGMGVLEAMACGIPVVSASVGEIPYLWSNRVTAMLVLDDNPVSFSQAIEQLFDEPDLAGSISVSARKEAEKFDWNLNKSKWETLFNV